MRGYAPTEIPEDGCFGLGALVADAVGLHDVLGGDGRAVLIGSDWGAEVACGAAAFAPDRWRPQDRRPDVRASYGYLTIIFPNGPWFPPSGSLSAPSAFVPTRQWCGCGTWLMVWPPPSDYGLDRRPYAAV